MDKKSAQKSSKISNLEKGVKQNNKIRFPVKKEILGVGVSDITKEEVLELIGDFLRNSDTSCYITTPNPEMIVAAQKNLAFKNALNSSDLALCDGIGLSLAGQLLGQPVKERIIGTDLVESLCEKFSDWPIAVGFLGGKSGVAEKTAECLAGKYPKLKIGFVGSEWNDAQASNQEVSGIQKEDATSIQNTKYKIHNTIDILFVAFGAPKQELWMAEHIGKIPFRVMIGVGGAFDQIINPSLRPPLIINSIGLGWLYRLIRQPWRIKRQFALVEFVGMVIREKLGVRSDSSAPLK